MCAMYIVWTFLNINIAICNWIFRSEVHTCVCRQFHSSTSRPVCRSSRWCSLPVPELTREFGPLDLHVRWRSFREEPVSERCCSEWLRWKVQRGPISAREVRSCHKTSINVWCGKVLVCRQWWWKWRKCGCGAASAMWVKAMHFNRFDENWTKLIMSWQKMKYNNQSDQISPYS